MAGLSVWNGSSFVGGDPRIWNGSAFVPPSSCHVWDGAQFVKVWPTSLPIEYISSASAASNTVSMPTHQAGDLLIVIAGRSNNTPPGLESGWTNIENSGSNSRSVRAAYLVATSSSMATGTWTNAQFMSVLVLRNAEYRSHNIAGGANTVMYPAISGLATTDFVVRAAMTGIDGYPMAGTGWTTYASFESTTKFYAARKGPVGDTSLDGTTAATNNVTSGRAITIAFKLAGT